MIDKIKELAKDYTILYVEDQEDVREVLCETLRLMFKECYSAADGKIGYEVFKKKSPDIILSDISMPNQNGLEMAEKIKKENHEIPIIFLTAFSDTGFLMDAIKLGISRYLIKPLDKEKLFATLLDVLKSLKAIEESKKYQEKLLFERLNEKALTTLKQTTQIYPNPTFIFKNGILHFVNEKGLSLFDKSELEGELKELDLDAKFTQKEGYLSRLLEYDPESRNSRVLWQFKSGRRKIFLLNKHHLNDLDVYSFSDITRLEYEQIKNRNLNGYLFDMVRRIRKSERDIEHKLAKDKVILNETVEKNPEKSEKQVDYNQIRLEAMHYEEKEDAKSYCSSLDDDIVEDISEMQELENDLNVVLESLAESNSVENFQHLGRQLERFSKLISTLIEFEDISFSLEKIANFLLVMEDIENSQKLIILLEAIKDDLADWRKNIFELQIAQDIHYLDASLLSSCLQIESEFILKKEEDETNDLELF